MSIKTSSIDQLGEWTDKHLRVQKIKMKCCGWGQRIKQHENTKEERTNVKAKVNDTKNVGKFFNGYERKKNKHEGKKTKNMKSK